MGDSRISSSVYGKRRMMMTEDFLGEGDRDLASVYTALAKLPLLCRL